MAQEYSWINSAREYVKVYERARQMRAAANG
jgi:glycogen synthase